MNTQESIELIQTRINEIKDLEGLNNEHQGFKDWFKKSISIIEDIKDLQPKYLRDFANLPFHATRVNPGCNPPADSHDVSRYKEDLQIAKTLLESILDQLKLRSD